MLRPALGAASAAAVGAACSACEASGMAAAKSGEQRAEKAAAEKKSAEKAAPEKKSEKKSDPRSAPELLLSLSMRYREVFINGTIDDESARHVIAQLLFLEREAPGTPIRVNINSSGGKVAAGLAIHDVMRSLSSPVRTTCLGHCSSMAAVLLAAGQKGERYAQPNARIMIHQPRRGGSSGTQTAKELRISAEQIETSRRKTAALLARDTGRPVAEIEQLLEYDHYYSAEEAAAIGLIDRVASPGHFAPPPTTPTPTPPQTSQGSQTADPGTPEPPGGH